MASQAKSIRDRQPPDERRALDDAVARICVRLEELSARWSSLEIGSSMAIPWQDGAALRAERDFASAAPTRPNR